MSYAEQLNLPDPVKKGKVSLEETISKRRSVRQFNSTAVTMEDISQLLWAGQGITAQSGGYGLRAAPSAGALYPLELYLLTKDGLYRYIPESNKLEILKKSDLRRELMSAALGQESVGDAPVDIVITAVYSRVTGKYGKRGERYALIEAGHAAENIHLQAVALGLGSVPIGAFDDGSIARILSLPNGNEPIYIIPVGYAER